MDTADIYCNHKQTKKVASSELALKQYSILQQQSKNVEVTSLFFTLFLNISITVT